MGILLRLGKGSIITEYIKIGLWFTMSDPTEWIRDLMPPDQVEQLQAQAKKIVQAGPADDEPIYEMSLIMSESDMYMAVENFEKMKEGDTDAWMYGISMLMALVQTIKYALNTFMEGESDEDADS